MGEGNIIIDKSPISFGRSGAFEEGVGLSCLRILYTPNLIHLAEIANTYELVSWFPQENFATIFCQDDEKKAQTYLSKS